MIKYLYSLYKEGKNELVNPPLSVQTNNLLNYFQINNYKTRLSYNQKDEKELNDYSMTNSKYLSG